MITKNPQTCHLRAHGETGICQLGHNYMNSLHRLKRNALRQVFRLPGARLLGSKLPITSLETRVSLGLGQKPMYTFGIYSAAVLAKGLGLKGISAIEFGVAGGRGLLAMEKAAEEVGRHFGIAIDVFGFDTGKGLPPATDYRDLPYKWNQGHFMMDFERLRQRLKRAQLILGDVGETVPEFLPRIKHPLGFVSFDMDYYSSTVKAFQLWDGAPETRLPRVMCYFDDICGYNDYIGELLAISEYNRDHEHMKLCPMHLLRNTQQSPAWWHDQIYMLHDFQHPQYCVSARLRAPDPRAVAIP